jgi:transposase
VPIYYKSYAGNQHDARFFDEHLDEIVGKIEEAGGTGELTLIFDKGMNAEGNIQRIDGNDRLHFITSYCPYFSPELARIPLKHFRVLPCKANTKRSDPHDHVLYYETEASFWGLAPSGDHHL